MMSNYMNEYKGFEITYRLRLSGVDAVASYNGERQWALDTFGQSKEDAYRRIKNRIDNHLSDQGK